MEKIRKVVFAIGRNKLYPWVAVAIVTVAYLLTNPINDFSWRYLASYIGAVAGLVCVVLLARGKNSGNTMGIVASVGESSGNFLGGNIGAALPSVYYLVTHLYGLVTWRKHSDAKHEVKTRKLSEVNFVGVIIFFIIAALINIAITGALSIDNSIWQLTINNFIFALAIVAQFLMIMRYDFSWYLWIILNVMTIGLNIYTGNPVIAVQYCLYLFNAFFGLMEWQQSRKHKK